MSGKDIVVKMERARTKRVTVIFVLVIAVALQAAVVLLTPAAKEYGWKQFFLEPMFLLRYVLRPFACVLFGWAVVEAAREFVGIRIWDGKSEKTRKTVRTVFYVLVGCLAIAAVLTLWLGVEMAYQWYLAEKMMREQGCFNSSAVFHLMPERLVSWILYFDVSCLDGIGIFGGVYCFLGAALDFCRIDKGKLEKESKDRME